MDGLKDYQISVYVANLGKYVEGVLQGAWITLPMPAERLQDTLKTEVGLGGRYEEYAIHDYEGGEGLLATVANPVEYESLTDLNLMCRAFEAREDDDPDDSEPDDVVAEYSRLPAGRAFIDRLDGFGFNNSDVTVFCGTGDSSS